MNLERIRQDLLFLAGKLAHRGAQSDAEHEAARFIRGRLEAFTSDISLENFSAVDNYLWLFASFYSEFVVVAILAIWWPPVAFVYGLFVFVGYLAEFHGYRLFSRLMPQFESQNVLGQFLSLRPEKLIILCAHYDSGCATPLTHPKIVPWRKLVHWLVLASMILIMATCVLDTMALWREGAYTFTAPLRWLAASLLVNIAIAMFFSATQAEDTRGANANASGVAALLQVAEKVAADPPKNADVWFLATGSHETWMSGMSNFMASHHLDRDNTFFINLESVGAGDLHYLKREGMLLPSSSSPVLQKAAQAIAPQYQVTPASLSTIVSGAHIPLSRGYHALSIMGLNQEGYPAHWNWHTDRFMEVDEKRIAEASAFAYALIEKLSPPESSPIDA